MPYFFYSYSLVVARNAGIWYDNENEKEERSKAQQTSRLIQ